MRLGGSLTSKAIILDGDDIDTDQIIPGRFVYTPRDIGDFGYRFFFDQRFDQNDKPFKDHPLNVADRGQNRVLVTGSNFGCGSARPQAVWAVQDWGFEIVIAPSFGPVFRSNASRLGLVLITLPEPQIASMIEEMKHASAAELRIDFETSEIVAGGSSFPFAINMLDAFCLNSGQPDLHLTKQLQSDVDQFQKAYREKFCWI